MMLSINFLITASALAAHLVVASSFYDNPEQDPIPENGTPLDELQAKWSNDVRDHESSVILLVV